MRIILVLLSLSTLSFAQYNPYIQNMNIQGGPCDGILARASPAAIRAYSQIVQDLSQSLGDMRTALERWAKNYGLEQEFKKFTIDSEKENTDFKKAMTDLFPKLTQFFNSYIRIADDKRQSVMNAFNKTADLAKSLDDKQKTIVEFIMKTYMPSLGSIMPENQGNVWGNNGGCNGNKNNGGFPGNNGGFPGNNWGYQGNNGGFPGNTGGFQGNNGGFPGNTGGFQGNNGGFSGNNGGFQGNNGGFPGNTGGFQGNNGVYPGNTGGYQGNNGWSSTNNGMFGGGNGGFPLGNQGSGFQGGNSGFPGNNGGFGTNNNQNNNNGYQGGFPKRPHFGSNALQDNKQFRF